MADEKLLVRTSSTMVRPHNESLLGNLHSPKSRLRKAIEVGRETVSLLRELGDIALNEEPTTTSMISAPMATVLPNPHLTLVGARTPTRDALRQTRLAVVSGGSVGRLRSPLRYQNPYTPLRLNDGQTLTDANNSSSVTSDSPVVMRSPLHASTPTSAARQLRQSRLVNNSMDDPEFDLLLTVAIGMVDNNDPPSPPPRKATEEIVTKSIDMEVDPAPLLTSNRRSQRLMNNSMDDSFMNALLCSQADAPKPKMSKSPAAAAAITRRTSPRVSAAARGVLAAAVVQEKDEEGISIINDKLKTSATTVNVKPSPLNATTRSVVAAPKLTRHVSHTTNLTSPTSSHPGRTVEMATRMRRHRSLIDEMKACNMVKSTDPLLNRPTTSAASVEHPSLAAVAQPPTRSSPAFNSTLLKPSTLHRYMNRAMQQTLPGGPLLTKAMTYGTSNGAAVSPTIGTTDQQQWMSKRVSQSVANVRPSCRSRPLGAIENSAASSARKRLNDDFAGLATASRSPTLAAKRPAPSPACHDYNNDVLIVADDPPGAIVTAPTAGGFISKRLASQIIGTAAANPQRYIPPQNDSFYDDDIEFVV